MVFGKQGLDILCRVCVCVVMFSLILADILIMGGEDLLASWATVILASLLIGFMTKPFFYRQFTSLGGLKVSVWIVGHSCVAPGPDIMLRRSVKITFCDEFSCSSPI